MARRRPTRSPRPGPPSRTGLFPCHAFSLGCQAMRHLLTLVVSLLAELSTSDVLGFPLSLRPRLAHAVSPLLFSVCATSIVHAFGSIRLISSPPLFPSKQFPRRDADPFDDLEHRRTRFCGRRSPQHTMIRRFPRGSSVAAPHRLGNNEEPRHDFPSVAERGLRQEGECKQEVQPRRPV